MTLYGRHISVAVAGLVISNPRINVQIERQADGTQTTGTVKIYNLSTAREQQIYNRGSAITIEVGYPGTIATIFDGQLQRVQHPRQNLARVTHIELGDGVHEKDRLGGTTSRSYDGPVRIRQIARDFVSDMDKGKTPEGFGGFGSLGDFVPDARPALGLSVGPLDHIPADATITNFAYAGPANEGLTLALKRVGVRWFEDDGVIRFRAPGTTQPDAPTVRVSPSTGLIGAALPTDEGAECNHVPESTGQGWRQAGTGISVAVRRLPYRWPAP